MRNRGGCRGRRRQCYCRRGWENASAEQGSSKSHGRRKTRYDIRLQTMSRRIRAGVVGVGSIGRNHARIYSDLPGVEFAAILDTNPEAASLICQQHGAKAAAALPEFADLVDVATVSTPTPDHYEIGKFLLNQGKHLLIEKPIT